MSTADLAVRGGRVVTEESVRAGDVLITGGLIEAVVEPAGGASFEEIDARGLVIFPGVVDAHAYVNEPGREDWEGWLAASRGAAAGGVTTIADMPLNSIPPTIDEEGVRAKMSSAARSSIVDYALWGGLVGSDPRPLRELKRHGVVGLKAFLCPSGVAEFPHLASEALAPALEAAAANDLLVAVHAEDEGVIDQAAAQVRGRSDRGAWLESRPSAAEGRAVERLAAAAKVSGARVHVAHASSPEAVGTVLSSRSAGITMSVETCPHYLFFSAEDVERAGPSLKCAPPIRDASSRDRLWRHVLAGEVDLVASDHSPCTAELKARGNDDIFKAWGGITGIQSLLPAMLTEGVHGRGLRLESLARLVAGAPARLLGLWPRKGAIHPGADADLALIDLDREWTLTRDQLQARAGLSPYVGQRFRGQVARTIVHGTTVFQGGTFVDEKRYIRFGRHVPRMSA